MKRSILAAALVALSSTAAFAQAPVSDVELPMLVRGALGPSVALAGEGRTSLPRYLLAHLNADPSDDLVVPLYVDKAKGTLNARKVLAIPLHAEKTPDEAIGEHCLGLAIFRGSDRAGAFEVSATYLAYECFSRLTRVKAGASVLAKVGASPDLDGLLLDLESGGQMVVFWKGDNFQGAYVRHGD